MALQEVELFERVVLPHLDDAYALARYLLRDEHDAQDVVQDAVLRAMRYFDGFRHGDARSWLLAIVRNCCHTWHGRRRNAGVMVSYADADTSPHLQAPGHTDALAVQRSERDAIERALAALPLEFREVVILRELNDMSYKDIATIVGVPVGTVMSRLARARKRLASSLGLLVQEAS